MSRPLPSVAEVTADEVGTLFCLGKGGGFAYHFAKVISTGRRNFNFRRAFRSACHRGPQVGGIAAVYAAAFHAYRIEDLKIHQDNDNYIVFFGNACGGAAVAAKRGLRSASFSALCFGTGVTAAILWFELLRKEEDKLKYLDANNLSAHSHSNKLKFFFSSSSF